MKGVNIFNIKSFIKNPFLWIILWEQKSVLELNFNCIFVQFSVKHCQSVN